MHYTSHMLLKCVALWCAIDSGNTARSAVSPEILANFAKNIASVLSPVILGELQARSTRNNRSSLESVLTAASPANDDDSNASLTVDNLVDKTTNTAKFYRPHTVYPYNGLYEGNTPLENSQTNERIRGSLRGESYRRQEQPGTFYGSYDLPNSGNFEATQRSTARIEPTTANIDGSASNQYSSYHGIGFHKAALSPEPYAGFHGFGPYGHFPGYHHHGHHHHHPYGSSNGGDGEAPPSDDAAPPEQSARLDNNGTNYGGYGYGSPYFGNHGYHHPYSSFPFGGYGPNHGPFYGPYNGNNSSTNGRNGYGYGAYHGGPDFYGPPGYGYNNGYGNNNNGNNNNGNNGSSRQTEEPAGNDDQNNATKNGYPRPYGPPLVKPLLGTFHLHGFPSPFNLLPYDHFHFGVLKGGPVLGVGHVGYPIYADPYPIGFPFHYPYGPSFHGKSYLPPKDKPADANESGQPSESSDLGETSQPPAGELAENENPERISALSGKIVAPAPTSNRDKMSGRKALKRITLANSDSRRA